MTKLTYWQYDVQLYHQIFFAFYSIEKLKINSKKQNLTGCFYHIQSLLNSLANISKIISSDDAYKQHLNIEFEKVKNIRDRTIRNINEHIEEHLLNKQNERPLYSDMSISEYTLNCTKEYAIKRHFNYKTNSIQFVNRHSQILTMSIDELFRELTYLKSLKPISYIFDRYGETEQIL